MDRATKQDVQASQRTTLHATKIMGWFRFFLGVFTSVVVTLLIVNATIREKNVETCQARHVVWSELSGFLGDAATARRESGDIATAKSYEARKARIDKHTKKSCNGENPSLIPFVK